MVRLFFQELFMGQSPAAADRVKQLHRQLDDAIVALSKYQDLERAGADYSDERYKEYQVLIEDAIRDVSCALGYQVNLYKLPF